MSDKKDQIKMWLEIFGTAYLDSDNIKWKLIDGKLIGKRSVLTFDLCTCWIEETEINNIKSWWCGKDSDYSEIF
jgi:hypothetical protein